jgi:hypothetical protein
MGKPKSTPKQIETRLLKRIAKAESGCWLWLGPVSWDGYGRIWNPYVQEMTGAHRLAYTLWCGPIGEGQQVMHACDNRLCCNPAHLGLGTLQENVADMVRKGRQPRGETHGPDVSKVAEQARVYGIGDRAIRHIREGKRWPHAGKDIGRVAVQ